MFVWLRIRVRSWLVSREGTLPIFMFHWSARNFIRCLPQLLTVLGDHIQISSWLRRAKLAALAARAASPSPDGLIFHFIYGLKAREEMPFYGYAAVKSAKEANPNSIVLFHCHYEPHGEYWGAIRNEVVLITCPNPRFYRTARLYHYAHKADILRLLALKHVGGVYLDIDTVTLRSFASVSGAEFCIGIQANLGSSKGGLCNATMYSKPNSRFVRRWLRTYSSFASTGRDALWDFHSVKLPLYLASRHPEELYIAKYTAFCFPLWNGLRQVIFKPDSFVTSGHLLDESTSVHLWNNMMGPELDQWAITASVDPGTVFGELCARYGIRPTEAALDQLMAPSPALAKPPEVSPPARRRRRNSSALM